MIDVMAAPARGAQVVTPSDTTALFPRARSLYIGSSGDVAVIMDDGSEAIFEGASGVLPIIVRRVSATSTTATGILALY